MFEDSNVMVPVLLLAIGYLQRDKIMKFVSRLKQKPRHSTEKPDPNPGKHSASGGIKEDTATLLMDGGFQLNQLLYKTKNGVIQEHDGKPMVYVGKSFSLSDNDMLADGEEVPIVRADADVMWNRAFVTEHNHVGTMDLDRTVGSDQFFAQIQEDDLDGDTQRSLYICTRNHLGRKQNPIFVIYQGKSAKTTELRIPLEGSDAARLYFGGRESGLEDKYYTAGTNIFYLGKQAFQVVADKMSNADDIACELEIVK